MTEWHRWWQDRCHADHVEVRIANSGAWHLANIVTTDGTVVELLDSAIDAVEIARREHFYDNMMWLLDGRITTNIELWGDNFAIVSGLPEFVHWMKKDVFVDTYWGILRVLERKEGQCRWLAEREHSFVKGHFDGISDCQDMTDAYASKTFTAAAETRINATLNKGSIYIKDYQGLRLVKDNGSRWHSFKWIVARSAVLEEQEREKAQFKKRQEQEENAATLRRAELERERQRCLVPPELMRQRKKDAVRQANFEKRWALKRKAEGQAEYEERRKSAVAFGPMDKYLARSREENDE